MIPWNSSFYKVATWCFPFLPSSKKHQSSLALPIQRTHKHSFSLTELTATLNLNSEIYKRRVCFNSCFYIETLELFLSRQLVLKASFHCPIFSMPSCQGTPIEVFQNKGTKQRRIRGWYLLHARAPYIGSPYMLMCGFSPQFIFINLLIYWPVEY